MPFFTLKHCLICYKEDNVANNQQDISSARALNKKTEICRRFCTLASRYLDLDPYHFNPTKTITSKTIISYERACDQCIQLLLSFCDIFQQYEYLKLQLSWRAYEISQTMRHADKENTNHRTALKDKLLTMGSTLEEIDDFRTDFMDSIVLKRKQSSPTVVLKHEEAGEDPDFIEIKVPNPQHVKDKKRKMDPNKGKGVNKSQEKKKDNKSPTNAKPGRSERVINTAHSTTQRNDTDSFRKGTTNREPGPSSRIEQQDETQNDQKPKRLKISLKNRRPIDADEATMDESFDSTGNELIPEDSHNNRSNKKPVDNPVIIFNNKNNINLVSSLKDCSYQCQDIVLHRVGDNKTTAVTAERPFPQKVDDGVVLSDRTNEWPSDLVFSDPMLKDNDNIENGYYQQFDYLQYICPFLNCGRKFKTMTRMMIHQKVTGHNFNSVITITSK